MKGISRGMSWENVSQVNENDKSLTSDKLESSLVKIPQVVLDEAFKQQTAFADEKVLHQTEPTKTHENSRELPSFEDLIKRFLGASHSHLEPRRSRPATGKIRNRPRTSSMFPISRHPEISTLNVNGNSVIQKPNVNERYKALVKQDKEELASRIETYIPMPKSANIRESSPSVQRSENDDSRLLRVDDSILVNYLKDNTSNSRHPSPKTPKPNAHISSKSLGQTALGKISAIDSSAPNRKRRTGSEFMIKLRQRTPDVLENQLGSSETPTTFRVDSPAKQPTLKISPVVTPKPTQPSLLDELYSHVQTDESDDLLFTPRQEVSVLRPKIVCIESSRLVENSTTPMPRHFIPTAFAPKYIQHFSVSIEKSKKLSGKLFKGRSLLPIAPIKSRYMRNLRISSV